MPPPPNGVYTAFSFIGFVFCAIPFYWHLEGTWKYLIIGAPILSLYGIAWNTGTCLYMVWVGLGCLLQCINSIVWSKNIIDRAPVYCDICKSLDKSSLENSLILRHSTATRIQVALNVAIPVCSLCINRRLYKIATMKAVMTTSSEKRRAVKYDLVIGVGIPILQIIARECRQPSTFVRLFSRMQMQSVLFRRIVTTYLRISALISLW
jgi:pheromone a factor receptor